MTRGTNPLRARSLLGSSDSTNEGTPIVNQAAIVRWIGSNGDAGGGVWNRCAPSPSRPMTRASVTA